MDEEQAHFNLVDEPWIKTITLEGDNVELSLRELFHRAHTLRALANDVATQNLAILRILLAILQRSIVDRLDEYEYPSEAWGDLWDAKRMPTDEVDDYLDRWHHRFDLFDPVEPFMQVAGMQATNGSVSDNRPLLSKSKNKPTLFPQLTLSGLNCLSFSDAARWLVNVQAFDTSGIRSGVVQPYGESEFRSSPIGPSWAGSLGGVYLEGETLFETLMLNLCLCLDCRDNPDEFFDCEIDLPVWEQAQDDVMRETRKPLGYADLYTWQSRRVVLKEKHGKVNGVIVTNGDKLEEYNERRNEPMTSWERNKNKESSLNIKPVYTPIKHTSSKAMWRGIASLLPQIYKQSNELVVIPGVFLWAFHLSSINGGRRISGHINLRAHAVGYDFVDAKRSSIRELVDDTLVFKASLISPQGVDAIEMVVGCMESTNQAVKAFGEFAERIELATGLDTHLSSGPREAAKAEAYYELDGAFRSWLSQLTPDSLYRRQTEWYVEARRIIGMLGQKVVDDACPAALMGRKVKKGKLQVWVSAGKAKAQFDRDLAKALPISTDTQKEGGLGQHEV